MRKYINRKTVLLALAAVLLAGVPLALVAQSYLDTIQGAGLQYQAMNPVNRWVGYQQDQTLAGTTVALRANNGGAASGAIWSLPPSPAADVSITPSGDNKVICWRGYIPYGFTATTARMLNDIATDSGSDETLGIGIYPDSDSGAAIATGQSDDATTDAVEAITLSPAAQVVGPGMYRVCACAQDVSGSVIGGGQLVDDEFLDFGNAGDVIVGEAANDCTAGAMPSTTGALSAVDNGIIGVKFGP